MSRHRLRALALAALMVGAVLASTVALSGSVAASVTDGSLDVTNDPVTPDGNITVEGTAAGTGNVTFLIDGPNSSPERVTKNITSTSFTAEVNLSSLNLSDGTATIYADEGTSYDDAEDSTTFVVDDESPTVDIESPPDDAENTSAPTIEGSASDDAGIDEVNITLQRTNDSQYYDGSGWQSSPTWLGVSRSGNSWSYNTTGAGGDGTYNVTVRVTDEAGHTTAWSGGPPTPVEDSATLQVEYTLDATLPTINSVTVTEQDGDDTVSPGDTVNVSANTTDATSGIASVTVDASRLGGPDSLTLSHNSGDVYYDSFDVGEPTVSDGSVSLTVTATDAFDNDATDSDSVTLDTAIDSVGSLTVHQDFVGVVEDGNTSIRVTASEVWDAQDNPIASDGGNQTATLAVGGATYSVNVTDGAIDARIDPTAIANDTSTGNVTVDVVEAQTVEKADTVRLVHEARDLDEGYQLTGTPMDAETVVIDNVSEVTTYDPTASGTEWVSPAEEQAGEGYYVYGNASDARIGYVFSQDGDPHVETLHAGEYNLVAAAPDLNAGDSVNVGSDLGASVDVTSSNVEVYVRNSNDLSETSSDASGSSAFDEVTTNSKDVSGYDGYYVYVGSDELRTVDEADYNP